MPHTVLVAIMKSMVFAQHISWPVQTSVSDSTCIMEKLKLLILIRCADITCLCKYFMYIQFTLLYGAKRSIV